MKPIPMTKRCPKCGRDLPFSEFYFSRARMTFTTYCKACHNTMGRAYYAADKKKTTVNNCVHYSAEEIDYLKKNYKKQTAVQIALFLHRTAQSIRRKAFMLGLRKITTRKQ